MPKSFQIEIGGATDGQIDEIVDEFLKLHVSRDRQPVLLFATEGDKVHTLRRTSNGTPLFRNIQVKDRTSLRDCVAQLLTRRGTVLVGLAEGSAAREDV